MKSRRPSIRNWKTRVRQFSRYRRFRLIQII
ncbi:host specificity protein J, partial [Shigella boydii]|nr:host specificity protein J [Shigella boydii]